MRMQPIFLGLCFLSLGCLFYTAGLGLMVSFGGAERSHLIGSHFVWGLGTGVLVSLAHSVVLVYLLGTGKAIKEQIEQGNLAQDFHDRSKQLMGLALVPCMGGIVLVLLAAFFGGFTMIQVLPREVHLAVAMLGVLGQAPVMLREYVLIGRNRRMMDEVVEILGASGVRLTI